jgi:hypothetical protein
MSKVEVKIEAVKSTSAACERLPQRTGIGGVAINVKKLFELFSHIFCRLVNFHPSIYLVPRIVVIYSAPCEIAHCTAELSLTI